MTSKYLLIFLMSVLLTACFSESEPPPPEIIRPVKMVTISDQSAENLRTFPAVVEAVNESELAFRVSGQIIKRPVRAGQEIQKGDLIAELDPKDYQTEVANRQATYNLAKAQYDRAAKVVEQGHISRSDFDSRKAEMLAARAALKRARDNLSYTKIYAPFSGEVSKLHAEQFEFVNVKQPIVTIQTTDSVYVTIQVPEQVIAMIEDPEEAQKVKTEVIFDARPEERFLANFHEIDTQADPATRTYRVRVILPSPENFSVLAGMSATATVDLNKLAGSKKDYLTVPSSAVFQSENDGQQYVWVFDPQTQQVQQRAVSTGTLTEAGMKVYEGLATGEQVVVAGVYQIRAGMQVRPVVNERGL